MNLPFLLSFLLPGTYHRVHLVMGSSFVMNNLSTWVKNLKNKGSGYTNWTEWKHLKEINELLETIDGMVMKFVSSSFLSIRLWLWRPVETTVIFKIIVFLVVGSPQRWNFCTVPGCCGTSVGRHEEKACPRNIKCSTYSMASSNGNWWTIFYCLVSNQFYAIWF